jgi:hypothetical protein
MIAVPNIGSFEQIAASTWIKKTYIISSELYNLIFITKRSLTKIWRRTVTVVKEKILQRQK